MPPQTAERWTHLEALFASCLELPEGERAAWLAEACAGSPELAARVEELLRADAEAGDALEKPRIAGLGDSHRELEGRCLGLYRIGTRIGEGGMGTVFLASREDGIFGDRHFAFKLLRRELVGETERRRFHAERQILARLDHPMIARLYDGGELEGGWPYLVLEHVDGLPLDEDCRKRRATIEERLERMVAICSAVHHAHRNLVVHRDLKPSNILVTRDGVPKLLDFGIAKALDPVTLGTASRTTALFPALTPDYASPEQARGEILTTATDIYSLGVVLFELLTGRLPFELAGRPLREVEEILTHSPPPRPSEVAAELLEEEAATLRLRPDTLSRRLSGELDDIVLMALRKEPERRYGSARELAEDLERHLAERPVRATRDTWSYRAGKLLRRHRGTALATASALALLVAMLAMSFVQTRRTLAEQARSERTLGILQDVLQAADPESADGGPAAGPVAFLDRGARRVEVLDEDPEVQAELLGMIGDLYAKLGQMPKAEEMFRRALEAVEGQGARRSLVMASLVRRLGDNLIQQGRPHEAEPYLRRALALAEAAVGLQSPELIPHLLSLAGGLSGHDSESEKSARRALELLGRMPRPSVEARAEGLQLLGSLLFAQQKTDEAEHHLRQPIAILAPHANEYPLLRARVLDQLGTKLLEQGRAREAEELIRQGHMLRYDRLGAEHPAVARSLHLLIRARALLGDWDGAKQAGEEAVRVARATMDPEENVNLSYPLVSLARLYVELGRLRDAELLYAEAIGLRRRLLPAASWEIAYAESGLAACWLEQGKTEAARELLESSAAVILRAVGPETSIARTVAERLERLEEVVAAGS